MGSELEDYDFVKCNFPPSPWPIEKIDGKVSCDLTCYDAPTSFAKDILSHKDLQVLRLFTDNLSSIPGGIGNLKNLEELVLCHFESHTHSHLTQLPATLKNLRKLKHLDIRRNPLLKFPKQITSLSTLEELHVISCEFLSLPKELEQLQKLKVLDISHNNFETLPVCVTKLKNLTRLYASGGNLQTLCKEIQNLTKLERLQLTDNRLTSLPDELFNLVNLKKLHLNGNELVSLNDKIGQLVNLEYLVLNANKLNKLPHTLENLKELCYLNLHENMLTRLPECVTNLPKMNTLLIGNNPLQVPPVHVCNQGIRSIAGYFKAMKNTGNIHSKRLKVILLGESMAGKTSLVNALVEGEACEIDQKDRTFGVVFYNWKPEPDVDELELLVMDCAGQRKYQMTHKMFLSEGALFVLAVDLSGYKFDNPEVYRATVGEWITLVAAMVPRARILIVPTHTDKCLGQEDIDLKCEDILTKVKEDRQEMLDEFEKKFKHVLKNADPCIPKEDRDKLDDENKKRKNNLPVISLHYQEKSFDNIKRPDLSMNVLPVSNVGTLEGMTGLRKELVRIARNKYLSPTVDQELPESWVKIERTVKEVRSDTTMPCMSETELKSRLNERDVDVGDPELYSSCLTYLCAIGKLLYFKEIDGLVKKVVLDPYWLASVLRRVFRHDLNESLAYHGDFRKLGVAKFQLEQDKKQLFDGGIMEQRLLRCIWFKDVEPYDEVSAMLLTMLEHFGWACKIAACPDDLDNVDGAPRYLMPWFLGCQCPNRLETIWPFRADNSQVGVTAGFEILQYLPFGVFERFIVRCHSRNPDDYEHWQNGLYMKFGEVSVRGCVSHCKKCSTIKLAARAPKQNLEDLWKTLLILLKEVQKLLDEWHGMNYIHFTFCPECIKLGVDYPHYFSHNWFDAHNHRKRKATCKNKENGNVHNVDLDHLFPSNGVLLEIQNPNTNLNVLPEDGDLPEEILDEVAKKLGSKWTELARKLNMGDEVDIITHDYKDDTQEQAVQFFNKWKRKSGERAKRSIICKALVDMEYNDIAQFIEISCPKNEEGSAS